MSELDSKLEATSQRAGAIGLPEQITSCLFDLDGVLTSTARLHARAWKSTFDRFLASDVAGESGRHGPFDANLDYRDYLDGRIREDGVRAFLRSREISIPEGNRDDPPGATTVFGLGNAKNMLLLELMRKDGIETFQGSIDFVRAARAAGLGTAVVSASANAISVLNQARIFDLFTVIIDGNIAAERSLRGKPQPDTFLAAAKDLKVKPGNAAVFEDALSGVEAGHAGEFG